jgi:hypothetical protein
MNVWADPTMTEGRRAFVGMLTAVVNGDLLNASRILCELDPAVIRTALVVAVGTSADTIKALCEDGESFHMTVDEYLVEMGLMAAGGAPC